MKHESLLDVEIGGIGRAVGSHGAVAEDADREVWAAARKVLRERRYGHAVVTAEWPEVVRDTIRIPLTITADEREAITIAELFVHDVFLILNLAAPGSFSGTIAIQGAGEFHLDARVFEYAWATSPTTVGVLPLAEVGEWYDRAAARFEKALFHLLHLARAAEDELLSVIRLSEAAKALDIRGLSVFRLRDGEIPAIHPVAENDDVSLQWIDAADLAASAVVGALQEQVRIRPLRA